MPQKGKYLLIILLFILTTTDYSLAKRDSLKVDREALLDLKSYLKQNNRINQGPYAQWTDTDPSPCNWTGITCTDGRVTGIELKGCSISGSLYPNFSALSQLTHLDLSKNTIDGSIPADLNKCRNLKYLNLSHNILGGELNLNGLRNLEVLDLTVNRLNGTIGRNFPGICTKLVAFNVSTNSFTGNITGSFEKCVFLKFIDISANRLTGSIGFPINGLTEFCASENNLTGEVPSDTFPKGCKLEFLDLSNNGLNGEFPGSIGNCGNLRFLDVSRNGFSGRVATGIGLLTQLEALLIGGNKFRRDIPRELLNCKNLEFLDFSRSRFGGEIQPILGEFVQLKFLLLHGNEYVSGIDSSGILDLPDLVRLDLSNNSFSGNLPVGLFSMRNLKFLILANNRFSGEIPVEVGKMKSLQALDLSQNRLTGGIPTSVGNLTSLLWLMLAENSLSGEIPPEIGECKSLLWLNLAENYLTGNIPASIANIGSDPKATFEENKRKDWETAGSGDCLSMKRWIPSSYPPFSFVYAIMNRQICRSTWNILLTGGGLFSICLNKNSRTRTVTTSGYLQLSGNNLSGPVPPEIGKMGNFSLVFLDRNRFSGELPREIGELPLMALNLSYNGFSGEIPAEIGGISCLQNLDLAYNNFSGEVPASLNRLTELEKFNASYNPMLIRGVVTAGQLTTFAAEAFLGDPLVEHPRNTINSTDVDGETVGHVARRNATSSYVFVAVFLTISGGTITALLLWKKSSPTRENCGSKRVHDVAKSTPSDSPNCSVLTVEKGMGFSYSELVGATHNFAEENMIGRGGCGTVYHGRLSDSRQVAVKKFFRADPTAEKEFLAEISAPNREGGSLIGKHLHPNLVTLYGWCQFESTRLLVYEFMEGGSLDDVIIDWTRLTWQMRRGIAIDVAKGLSFLHHECTPAVVHRDVKASNVLLDAKGNARVTDFGLARMVEPEESHVSTVVAGTVGYVAPEYGHTWQATTKGDVYSFGVLVMELATGRRTLGDGEECLVEWARRVGVQMGRGGREREMGELLSIGLWCTVESPSERPSMKEVVRMLVGI